MSSDKDPWAELEKHGNNLHARVVEKLRTVGWEVEISPYYVDAFQDKPREIDIVARKNYTATIGDIKTLTLEASIIIECKYFTDKEIGLFYVDRKNMKLAEEKVLRTCSIRDDRDDCKVDLSDLRSGSMLRDNPVAKLFSSSLSTNETDKPGNFTKALTQCLHSTISVMPTDNCNDQLFYGSDIASNFWIKLQFPIIVYNDGAALHQHSMTAFSKAKAAQQPLDKNESLQFEASYSWPTREKNCRDYFLVEVLSENYIDNFIRIKIDGECKLVLQAAGKTVKNLALLAAKKDIERRVAINNWQVKLTNS